MAACRFGCSLSRRMHATHIVTLLLLQLVGSLSATEADAQAEPTPAAGERAQAIQPTREAIYQHLAAEMKAVLGAEEHVQGVFAAVAGGMRDSVGLSVVPALQALVDGVVERAEDAWIDADEAGRALQVKHCIDGAEGDAQQVAKRALDKIRGCIEAVDEEGQRRTREAARLVNAIEDVSKRFVLALETCIKEEEAKEVSGAPSPSDSAPNTPATSPIAAEDATASSPVEPADNQSPSQTTGEEPEAERNAEGKPKCAKCKKSLENEASAGETKPEDEATADHTTEYKDKKNKGGKDYKGKDKSGKWKKEDPSISEESADVKVSDQSKHERKEKMKSKKGKDGETISKDQVSDRRGKKYKSAESAENYEDNSAEVVEKKHKKSGKKEEWKGKKEKSGEGSGEEKKGRKKRDLLALNDATVEDEEPDQVQGQEAEGARAEAAKAEGATSWPTEGATPEERRVIACLRSATLQPLIDEKTRSYQRLQAVLKRTSARQEEAPACVTEHVHKAQLKVAAIKQRMAACADRHMRQEL